MKNKVVHSSKKTGGSDDWETPAYIFDVLDEEFQFTLDPCATSETTKCEEFYTTESDGLVQDWGKHRVFCNPPYSQLKAWADKCRESAQAGALVVMLIAARTDTIAWHEHILGKGDIRFIKGRIKFVGAKWQAPFPSALVIFRPPHWIGQ